MTLEPNEERSKLVIPYKGFSKNRPKSATLGARRREYSDIFGEPDLEQGKAGSSSRPKSGKSGEESNKRYDIHGNVHPRY